MLIRGWCFYYLEEIIKGKIEIYAFRGYIMFFV